VALDQTRANQILDAIHGVTTLVFSVAPLRTRFMTANGSSTANGTELAAGGSYAAGDSAPSATWNAAASGTSSKQAVTQTNMPATTIVGIEEWDHAGTPKRQEFGALTASKTTAAGDTLSFSASSISSALA
jgi:hypothetical protein